MDPQDRIILSALNATFNKKIWFYFFVQGADFRGHRTELMKTSCLSFGFMGIFHVWFWQGVQSQAARNAGCQCPLEVFNTAAEDGEIRASLGGWPSAQGSSSEEVAFLVFRLNLPNCILCLLPISKPSATTEKSRLILDHLFTSLPDYSSPAPWASCPASSPFGLWPVWFPFSGLPIPWFKVRVRDCSPGSELICWDLITARFFSIFRLNKLLNTGKMRARD